MSAHRKNRNVRTTLLAGGVIAAVLAMAVTGSAVAGKLVTSPEIKDGGVYSPDLHNGGVRSADIRNGSIHMPDLSAGVKAQLGLSCEPGDEVDLAVNSQDVWTRTQVDPALNKPGGTISVDDSRRKGVVHLATYPKAGYADAGVIVPLGTVNENFTDGLFDMPNIRGPYTDQVAVNLYIDAGGDQDYLSFDEDGVFTGTPAGGGVYEPSGDQVLLSVDETTERTKINAPGTDNGSLLWAWVGVSGNDAQTAALIRFAGHDLAVC